MKISMKLCALALTFGLFSAGTVGAAAFLPLERMGRQHVVAAPAAHAFHLLCLKRPCRFEAPASPTT
jgi:hypothetical protein